MVCTYGLMVMCFARHVQYCNNALYNENKTIQNKTDWLTSKSLVDFYIWIR